MNSIRVTLILGFVRIIILHVCDIGLAIFSCDLCLVVLNQTSLVCTDKKVKRKGKKVGKGLTQIQQFIIYYIHSMVTGYQHHIYTTFN